MIPAFGEKDGETFTATAVRRGDVAITIDGERGHLLAQAFGARLLPIGYRPGSAIYQFTPARAEKWHALWAAGFSVKQTRIEGVIHWRYAGAGADNLLRHEAVLLARHPEISNDNL